MDKVIDRITLYQVREATEVPYEKVSSARRVAEITREVLNIHELDRELLGVMLVDGKNQLTGLNVVSIGGLASSLAAPREVFKAAILNSAAAIIVFHNHPSGDPTPSQEDRAITDRLRKAAGILGIALLDHVIVTDQEHFAFAETA